MTTACVWRYDSEERADRDEPEEEVAHDTKPAADGPRFIPGELPSRARMETGLSGDGIYLQPGDPDLLVLIRSDGDYAPLSLLEPVANERNQWQFEMPGTRLEPSDPRLATMIKLPHEGFYRLTRELEFGDQGHWLANAIVQLSYTRDAVPIVFIGQRTEGDQNVLFFSDQGVKIRRDQLEWLEPLAWYEGPRE